MAQRVKHLPAIPETRVQSLGREDPLEKEMATHSSTLAWKIPWTEKAGKLQSMGSQRVGHNWANSLRFLSEQCKEIEENDRMGKTRKLFKKIVNTKWTFNAKMGMVQDLTEAEYLMKRWQEYTEELYKKGLNDSDNHDGVVIHLEPDPGVWNQEGRRKHHYEQS